MSSSSHSSRSGLQHRQCAPSFLFLSRRCSVVLPELGSCTFNSRNCLYLVRHQSPAEAASCQYDNIPLAHQAFTVVGITAVPVVATTSFVAVASSVHASLARLKSGDVRNVKTKVALPIATARPGSRAVNMCYHHFATMQATGNSNCYAGLGYLGAAMATSISLWLQFFTLLSYIVFLKVYSHQPAGLSSSQMTGTEL